MLGTQKASILSTQTINYASATHSSNEQKRLHHNSMDAHHSQILEDLEPIDISQPAVNLEDFDEPEPPQLLSSAQKLEKMSATGPVIVDNQAHVNRDYVSQQPREKTRSKKKVIRKIVRKRTQDGRERVVEVTKTVIQRDGSKSITRLDPQKYESKNTFHLDSNINLSNQAKQLVIPNNDVKMMSGHDAYNSNSASKKNGTAGGNGG